MEEAERNMKEQDVAEQKPVGEKRNTLHADVKALEVEKKLDVAEQKLVGVREKTLLEVEAAKRLVVEVAMQHLLVMVMISIKTLVAEVGNHVGMKILIETKAN